MQVGSQTPVGGYQFLFFLFTTAIQYYVPMQNYEHQIFAYGNIYIHVGTLYDVMLKQTEQVKIARSIQINNNM